MSRYYKTQTFKNIVNHTRTVEIRNVKNRTHCHYSPVRTNPIVQPSSSIRFERVRNSLEFTL